MANLSAHAAKSHEFHPNSLRVSLAEIARWSYGDASTVARALDEGWRRAVRCAAADGSITHGEEFRLRSPHFRIAVDMEGRLLKTLKREVVTRKFKGLLEAYEKCPIKGDSLWTWPPPSTLAEGLVVKGVSMRRIGQTAVNREADEGRGPFLGTAMRHSRHALGAPPGR